MKLTLKKSLLFAAAFFAAANLFCAELPAELDGLIRGGVTAVHSLRFEDAEKDFSAILQKYPGQPYGYFGMPRSVAIMSDAAKAFSRPKAAMAGASSWFSTKRSERF